MKAFLRLLCALSLTAFFVACGGGGGSATSTPPPPPPPLSTPPLLFADAGPNQAVDEGDDVILSGDGSENADSFSWQQTYGPSVQLNLANTSTPTFTATSVSGETVLTFEVTVGDDSGNSRTDSVSVVVIFSNSAPLSRPADPVVLKGEDLPMFNGTAPDSLVAFRYEGGWAQIPIQVDERDIRSYGEIYDFLDHWALAGDPAARGDLYPFEDEFYTDPDTYMGPDTDPMLDDNDEVVLMARDTGSKVPSMPDPLGVIAGSGAEVRVSDPLDGTTGYVYLFKSAGGLDPSAGQSYVDYQFKLQSGDYLGTFRLVGVNPEVSTMSSDYYKRTFTSRLLSEVLRITAPGSSGIDILDRFKNRVERSTGLCNSNDSEATTEEEEGAFVANKSGPVRGIRSHMGKQSGAAIQQVHFFYEQREDTALHYRVHAISSRVLQLVDYDPAAVGMTYFNNNNPAGVIVDGVPDTITPGILQWELITGFHGSLVSIQDIVSSSHIWQRCQPTCESVSPPISSYYLDDNSYSEPLCPGDFAIGMSGQTVGFTPDTDPRTTSFALAFLSSLYYGSPGWTVADAEQLRAFSEDPLVTTLGNN